MLAARGRWRRNGELVFDGDRVSVWEDRNVLEKDDGDGLHNPGNVLAATELCTEKWLKWCIFILLCI